MHMPKPGHHTRSTVGSMNTQEILLAGGLAGAAARTSTAPLDRVKILYQVSETRKFSFRKAWLSTRGIVYNEGVLALWRGNGALMLRVVPYISIQFLSFEKYRSALSDTFGLHNMTAVRFTAGAAAGVTSVCCTYPLDLFRSRLAYQWGSNIKYHSASQVARTMVKEEGFRSLFKGIGASLMRELPLAGINFGVFETLKAHSATRWGYREHELPNSVRLGCGAAAGLLAQSATYPLDTVRRRMQVEPRTPNARYRSTLSTITVILKNEGASGFFKGFTMNWVKGALAVAVRFTTYDHIREIVLRRRHVSRPLVA